MINEIKVGSIIKCRVTGIKDYGIFVFVNKKYTGLIHISEASSFYVKDISEIVSVGDTIFCQVLEVNEIDGKLKLSIKDINYKLYSNDPIHETRLGFLPLKNKLNEWILEKLEYYKNN